MLLAQPQSGWPRIEGLRYTWCATEPHSVSGVGHVLKVQPLLREGSGGVRQQRVPLAPREITPHLLTQTFPLFPVLSLMQEYYS